MLDEVVGATVPELAAARLELVLTFVLVLGEAERRRVGHVHDRRRLAIAERAGAAADRDAQDRRAIVALVGAFAVVARLASDALRLGKISILENTFAEQFEIAQRALVVGAMEGRGMPEHAETPGGLP